MTSLLPGKLNNKNLKVAYVHAISYPSTEANTFDAIWTADALSEVVDTTFFVPRISASLTSLKNFYEIDESSLHIKSMHLDWVPDRVLLKRRSAYERLLTHYFHYHPTWSGFDGTKVLYVREPRELLYWGINRQKFNWMKKWIICYEAHDPLGMDPNKFEETNPFSLTEGPEGQLRQEILQAAKNVDVIICNTQTLADDLRAWTANALNPSVLTLASPLPRLSAAPKVHFGEKIVIGYIGTIDKYRGVDILLDAIYHLPPKFHLRIVGRLRKEAGVSPDWLNKYREDPEIKDRVEINLVDQIKDVAGEIDRCDILIQPASNDVIDSRYAAPLKSYGYMMRGKPIVAGNVLSHRELFNQGKNAMLYELNPESLAESIVYLAEHPDLAGHIAYHAWEQASNYTFARKVDDMLAIFEGVNQKKLKLN